VCFVRFGVYGLYAYRDKKVVGIFVRFRAPLPMESDAAATAIFGEYGELFARIGINVRKPLEQKPGPRSRLAIQESLEPTSA
jgi:hypothetical protein